MKNLILCVMAMLASTHALAQDNVGYQSVRVTDAQGTYLLFAFSDKPTVTFTEDYVVITAGDDEAQYPVSEMLTFEFVTEGTAVDQVKTDDTTCFRFTGSEIVATGLSAMQPVAVFTIDGKLVGQGRADSNGQWIMSLDELSDGSYVVKSNQTTFKFIVR